IVPLYLPAARWGARSFGSFPNTGTAGSVWPLWASRYFVLTYSKASSLVNATCLGATLVATSSPWSYRWISKLSGSKPGGNPACWICIDWVELLGIDKVSEGARLGAPLVKPRDHHDIGIA